MAESGITSPTSPALEALQNRSRDVRRARPPDITVIRNEARVPLRPPKRESRIGLRNIFSKSKIIKDEKIMEEAPSSGDSSRHGSKRSSLVDWPQRLNPSRSDLSLLSSPPSSIKSPASVTSTASSRLRQNSITNSQARLRQQASPKVRDSVTGFNPPPLFQMYPQAIKYATLPTCVTPIEALSRLNDNSQQNDFSRSNPNQGRKSKYAPEWTNKVYALVTSGYLLQYAGEGRFDRLPEKILHLTRESAAYASDLIPGKHWVVQVASSMDADGNPSIDTKSLRSKLALRGVEKRQVSNMLLVFENPELMDMWLAILRREIESLGGKKKLSETGKLETDEALLRNQASQRTLVVRDPARFSRIIPQDFSWNQENELSNPTEQNEPTEPRPERISESTMDDGSSMISSDGQRLDSLRDSNGSSGSSGNRLSFISSGQRTLVSSAESSPTNSPIRASFSSNGEDQLLQISQKPLPPTPEVRPRPNAAAIANRRQSMQTMIPSFDPRLDVRGRSISTLPSSLTSVQENKHQFVPNFSVPHTVGRRYSAMNLSAAASRENQQQTPDREGPIRPPVRRSPPTKLALSRPLSIVMDQPSPRSPYSPTGPPNHVRASIQAPDTPSMFAPQVDNAPKPMSPERSEVPESQILKQMTEEAHLTSTSVIAPFHEKRAMRASQQYQQYQQPKLPYFDIVDKSFIARPARTSSLDKLDPPEEIRRASSSMEMRRASINTGFGHQSYKHALLLSENPPHHNFHPHQNRHSFMHPSHSHLPSIEEPSYGLAPPLMITPKRSAPSLKASQQESMSSNYLAVDLSERALMTRRSLPHLAEGPPPAPPPTCALPPIPTKRSSNLRGIKA